jgi:hypothetical protein
MMACSGKFASRPVPRADPVLARGCTVCRGWGSVITDQGHHELCPECQSGTDDDDRAAGVPREDSQAVSILWQPLVEGADQGRLRGRA